MHNRPSPALLGALALAAAVPATQSLTPPQRKEPPLNLKAMRQSKRGSKPYKPKDGLSQLDRVRAETAEAKRERKRQGRRRS